MSIETKWDTSDDWRLAETRDQVDITPTGEIQLGSYPSENITHHWSFGDGSGLDVLDQIGSLDADFSDLIWGGPDGRYAHYGRLEGETHVGDLGSESRTELNHFANGFGSVLAWVRIDDDDDRNWVFGTTRNLSNANFQIDIFEGELRFLLGSGGDLRGNFGGGTVVEGVWTAIAATADGDHARIYIDGDEVASEVLDDGDDVMLDRNVTIGEDNATVGYNGDLDDIHVSDVGLTESEINAWIDATEGNYP